MEPWVISIVFYCIVLAVCELARKTADRFSAPGTVLRQFFYTAIGVTQLITCIYENGLVTKYYGVRTFFLVVALLIVAHATLSRGAVLSPSAAVEKIIFGSVTFTEFLSVFLAQCLGAYMAFRLARQVWWFHMSDDHMQQHGNFICNLSYKVPLFVMGLFELIGSFILRSVIGRTPLYYRKYVTAVMTSGALSIELSFFGPPGLNPITAAGRILGCKGLSTSAHLLIYWVCPMTGWLLAAFVQKQSEAPSIKPTAKPTKEPSAREPQQSGVERKKKQ